MSESEAVKKYECRVKGEVFEIHIEQYPDGLLGYRVYKVSQNSGMEHEVRHETGKYHSVQEAESHANMAAREYFNRERM